MSTASVLSGMKIDSSSTRSVMRGGACHGGRGGRQRWGRATRVQNRSSRRGAYRGRDDLHRRLK